MPVWTRRKHSERYTSCWVYINVKQCFKRDGRRVVVRKKTIIIFAVLLIIGFLGLSRTQGQPLKYQEVYSNVIGFGSFRDYNREIIPQDVYLFHDTSEWLNFKDKYLWRLNIPNPKEDEIFIVVQKEYSSLNSHAVKDIRINDKEVLVYVKKVWGGGGKISASIPISHFKDIIIISVNKKSINNDLKVVLQSHLI